LKGRWQEGVRSRRRQAGSCHWASSSIREGYESDLKKTAGVSDLRGSGGLVTENKEIFPSGVKWDTKEISFVPFRE